MKNRVFTLLKFLIGWPLSILALFFIGKLVAPQAPQFLSRLHEISPLLLMCGILSFLVYFFLRGYIWKRLVKQAGYEISYKDTNFIWASSELQRYIPGNIWSFLGRTVLLTEKGMTKKDIIKCTIFEIQLLILGAAVIPFLSLPFLIQHFSFPDYLTPVAYGMLLVIILLYTFHRKIKLKLFFLPNYTPVEILFLILLNAVLFLFFGLGYVFTFASFTPLDPNLIWQLTGISVLAYLVGYLSILTPSGFGVREGALVFALSKIMSTSVAGFVSLFGRFILIVAEVIFVALSYIWYATGKHVIARKHDEAISKPKGIATLSSFARNDAKIETWIGEHQQVAVLAVLTGIYTLYFTTITFMRYDNFYTGKFDLGNMSQTVWNTTQGRIFMFTNPNGTEIVSRLSAHADFILVLLAPFYALWPDPRNLLFIQTLVLAAGAFFIYFIAKQILKNKNLALVFAFTYLINPSIQRTNLYDFHAVTLATTFFLAAFYYFINKKYKLFLFFAFLAGICKEQLWLIIALFGVLLFFWHKKRFFGTSLFISCVLFSYLLISFAIPNALGAQHFALSYFSEFGDSPIEIVKHILFSPGQTITTMLQPDRVDYLRQLFLPLGYLSLFGAPFLIFAAPDLMISLLSNNPQLHQIYYQYTATVSPFLFIAAIYGVGFIKSSLREVERRSNLIRDRHALSKLGLAMTEKRINTMIIIYLLTISLYAAHLYGPLPGSKDANLDMITKQVDSKAIDQILFQIPQHAKVAASNNIASHLTNREYLFILPLGIEQAEYVVFYLTPSQPPESLATDKKLVEKLRSDPYYQVVTEQGILIIFKKVYAITRI